MKQQSGETMRKWSHTFSTCSQAAHLNSPRTDHGSCCHFCGLKSPANKHARSAPPVSSFTVKANSVHRKRRFLFPLVWLRRNRSIWQTEEDVFTHSWCSFTLEYIHPATSVRVCVSTAASVYQKKINLVADTSKRTWAQWGWNMTHTFPHTRQRAECAPRINLCALVTGPHVRGNKENTSFF